MAEFEIILPILYYFPVLDVPAAGRVDEICFQMHQWLGRTKHKAK